MNSTTGTEERPRKSQKYNWFQISNILKLGFYDREIVKIKHPTDEFTEEEWRKKLKKDEINF